MWKAHAYTSSKKLKDQSLNNSTCEVRDTGDSVHIVDVQIYEKANEKQTEPDDIEIISLVKILIEDNSLFDYKNKKMELIREKWFLGYVSIYHSLLIYNLIYNLI